MTVRRKTYRLYNVTRAHVFPSAGCTRRNNYWSATFWWITLGLLKDQQVASQSVYCIVRTLKYLICARTVGSNQHLPAASVSTASGFNATLLAPLVVLIFGVHQMGSDDGQNTYSNLKRKQLTDWNSRAFLISSKSFIKKISESIKLNGGYKNKDYIYSGQPIVQYFA